MFVSNFTLPVRFLQLLDEVAPAGSKLSDWSCDSHPAFDNAVDLACDGILSANLARVGSLDALDATRYMYVRRRDLPGISTDATKRGMGLVSVPVGKMVLVVTTSSPLIDPTRTVDDASLNPCDLVCAFQLLSKSQTGSFLLLRYDELRLWNIAPVKDLVDAFRAYGGLPTECRSVVIDLSHLGDDRAIASLPYYKFRNLNECDGYMEPEVRTRIADAVHGEFTDKLDGSMMQMRHLPDAADVFPDGLLLTSSGSLSPVTSDHVRFGYEYVRTHPAERFHDMCRENPGKTFIFEYVNPPLDPHVVAYPPEEWGMYLTGVRDVRTGELAYHDAVEAYGREYGIRVSRIFGSYDMDEALTVCHEDAPANREGFVLNVDGFLVKMKLDTFLGISKLVHSVASFNVVIRNVALGTMDDLIALVPQEHRPSVRETVGMLEGYDRDVRDCLDAFMASAGILGDDGSVTAGFDRKGFAMRVNSEVPRRWRGYAFSLANGKGLPGSFLGTKLDTDQPGFMSRAQFDEAREELDGWMGTLGIAR